MRRIRLGLRQGASKLKKKAVLPWRLFCVSRCCLSFLGIRVAVQGLYVAAETRAQAKTAQPPYVACHMPSNAANKQS